MPNIIGYLIIKPFNTYTVGDKFYCTTSDYINTPDKTSSLIPTWLCDSLPEYFQPIYSNTSGKSLFLTVGQLKKDLQFKPDNAKIYFERIQDIYFDKHHWSDKSKFKEDKEYGKGAPLTEFIEVSSILFYENDSDVYFTAHN